MNRQFLQFAAIVFFGPGIISCSSDRRDRFTWNPSADSVYHFRFEVEETQKQVGREMYAPEKLSILFSLRRSGWVDSMQVMTMRIRRITYTRMRDDFSVGKDGSLTVRSTNVPLVLSTEDTIAPQMMELTYFQGDKAWLDIVRPAVGDSMQIILNRLGEPQAVMGYDRIAERIAAATQYDKRTINQYLKKHIGEETIKDLFNQLCFYLPSKKVRQGDQWISNVTLNALAPVKYSHLITLKEIKGDEVNMDVQTVVSARTGEEGTVYAEGKLNGTVIAGYSSGMPLSGKFTEQTIVHTNYYDVSKTRTVSFTRYQSP